ncbi:hypothetical protein [Streptomyces sp. NPDC059575]|uniref:hypothetical protein n=1 Tax=Streptomyces sp. NPDC059575 TaxID=3346872 RepID=UPI0036C5BF14
MPSPRTSSPSTTSGSDALLYLLFGVLGAAMAFGSLAWLTGNLTNCLVGSGLWAPFRATEALLHPEVLWPSLSTTAQLIGVRIVPGLLTVSLATTGLVLWMRWRSDATSGLARKADLAPLLDREITAKAKSLRPSLGGRESKRGRSRRSRHPARHPRPGPGRGPRFVGGRDRRDHGPAKREDQRAGDPCDLVGARPGLAHQ